MNSEIDLTPQRKPASKLVLVGASMIIAIFVSAIIIANLPQDGSAKDVSGPEDVGASPVLGLAAQVDRASDDKVLGGESIDLITHDLRYWYTWLGVPHESTKIVRQNQGPLGVDHDPKRVFKVILMDDKPTLKISGEILGGISTLEEYGDYHLSTRFKWGNQSWPSAFTKEFYDSGILIHCTGAHGKQFAYWMASLEYQLRSWTAGDAWFMGTQGEISFTKIERGDRGPLRVYDPTAPLKNVTSWVVRPDQPNLDKTRWHTAEVYCLGTTVAYLLDGKVTNVIQNARTNPEDGSESKILTKGKIMLQSAGSEIFFQDIQLTKIKELPEFLSAMVK